MVWACYSWLSSVSAAAEAEVWSNEASCAWDTCAEEAEGTWNSTSRKEGVTCLAEEEALASAWAVVSGHCGSAAVRRCFVACVNCLLSAAPWKLILPEVSN